MQERYGRRIMQIIAGEMGMKRLIMINTLNDINKRGRK